MLYMGGVSDSLTIIVLKIDILKIYILFKGNYIPRHQFNQQYIIDKNVRTSLHTKKEKR